MTVLRVCYQKGARFDEKYYIERHAPLAAPIMASLGVRRSEIVKVSGSVPGFDAPYQYVFSAYFDSPGDVARCMIDPRMNAVLDDVRNYFDGASDVMVGEVIGAP